MNTPVRCLFLTAALALSSLCRSQNCDDNYVKCTTMLDSIGVRQSVAINYFDGAGRECVSTMRTALGGYSHALTTYDLKGRVCMKALPYLNGSIYCPDSATIISYIPGHYQGDHRAYTTYSYDDLNRVVAEVGPGEAWTSHPLSMSYGSNAANEVLYFYLNGENVSHQGNWPERSLTKETHTDEDGRTTVVYKDIRGLTLLSLKGGSKTYYVYDHRGQLRYVLPPVAVEQMSGNGTWGPSSPVVSKYAYVYRYDDRGYCVWKKLPGCEEQQLWYDRCGRIFYTEDGNLRANGDLRFCLYDDKGRLAVEGLCKADLLQYANRAIAVTQMTGTGICGGYEPFGSMDSIRLMTVYYYDDYTFMQTLPQGTSDSLAFIQTALVPAYSSARGFVTGRRVYQLGAEGAYEAQAFYYDRNGHVVQKNSSGGMRGTRHETTRYSFTGNPVERLVAFNANVNGTRHALTEAFSYEYNTYTDQLVSIAYSINGSTPVVLASYTYDALGRTATKTVGGIETVNYGYNIRSWPTKIQSAKFTELMGYNASVNGMTVSHPRWNGDISALCWKGGAEGATYRGYEFDYDDKDRLVCAWYGGGLNFSSTEDYYDEYFTYDRMGNITNLMRGGRLDDNSYSLIDDLDMEYDGNRLTRAYDYSSDDDPTYEGVMQFTDNSDEDVEYEYDANGNLTKDLNANISSIRYNCLNLPSRVTIASGGPSSLQYKVMDITYNADGEKLCVSPSLVMEIWPVLSPLQGGGAVQQQGGALPGGDPGPGTGTAPFDDPAIQDLSTRYCGNVVFERGEIARVLTDEGYITFAPNGKPMRHYYLRDHLGNIRVVFNQTGTVEQRNDYYPSGALMATSTGGSVQPYKYNGKELERTAGLDLYDYGARWMDSKIGARFTTIDPMCEKYYSVSPYTYCHGNPANFIDFFGLYVSTDVKKNKDGTYTVVNAHNDDDCNIYVVDNNMRRTGEIIGVTMQPFDFMDTNNKTGDFFFSSKTKKTIDLNHLTVSGAIRPTKGIETKIYNGDASGIIQWGMNSFAEVQQYKSSGFLQENLLLLAKLSKSLAPLDIKVSLGLDAYTAIKAGTNSNGYPVITTLRAVGNMLFGANLRSLKPIAFTESTFYHMVMPFVGLYNQLSNGGNLYNMSPPFYGEHEYSGSYIQYGYFGHF